MAVRARCQHSPCRPARRWGSLALALLALAAAPASPLHAGDGDVLLHGTVNFDLGGGLTDSAKGAAVQPDGKIVLVGTVSSASGGWNLAVARVLPNGNPDTTFGTGGRVINPFPVQSLDTWGAAVVVASDGRILVAGSLDFVGDHLFLIGRLLANGQPDPAFGNSTTPGLSYLVFDDGGGHSHADAAALTLDANGRPVVVGTAGMIAGSDFAVARLTTAGLPDNGFSGDGQTTVAVDPANSLSDIGRAVAIDRLGRIVVAGSTQTSTSVNGAFDFGIVRLLPDGGLDSSFNAGGRLAVGFDFGGNFADHAYAVAVQPDNKILVAGRAAVSGTSPWLWVVARLTENSTPQPLDSTFHSGQGYVVGDFACGPGDTACADRDAVYAMALQGDGRIVLAGEGGGLPPPTPHNLDFGAARLLANGQPDLSFGTHSGAMTFDFNRGTGSHNDGAYAWALAPDGRIVVAGYSEWNGLDTDFGWARLDNSYIFADGFDWGSTRAWSTAQP